jgi:hypothetical protein
MHEYIPEEIMRYDETFESDDDPFENDDTTDTIKILISIYYRYHKHDDPEGLGLIDCIHEKCCKHIDLQNGGWKVLPSSEIVRRQKLCMTAKHLIRKKNVSYVDALRLLFSKEDLQCYGY